MQQKEPENEANPSDLSLRTNKLRYLILLQRLGLELPSDDARILDLRRQLHEVTAELDFKKVSYAQVIEKARQQDKSLQQQQQQLQQQLLRFEKFIATNTEKTLRANQRAAAEKETLKKKETELKRLKRELELQELLLQQQQQQLADCGSAGQLPGRPGGPGSPTPLK
ncbi:hypothetical protein, conserved [Eimeria tenella]|uniref:DUF4200 domain-containing protein n=1 Tax=Eimeria tenella TaxID=5802 RepID=U6LA36_EIMTE|nr:hypothetical protein, conserved [Eimeria tenella]CDJ45404.1 hypothetical protein, conserved [Eimeria tenella]|eukprot:XP_013236150.1 hypothetical protein, conserved [Eimeria tenella]